MAQSFQASRVKRVVSDANCNIHGYRSQHPRRASSLPNELSSFIGRESQIDDVVSSLRTNRLVTLSGAGGIGKTRLALQIARRLRSESAVCTWVALSSTFAETELTSTVTTALCGGEFLNSASIDLALATIGDRELVLVLDNCEQVIVACADLVLRLLQECAGLRVLATSREALGVPGEVVYAVPPLALTRPDQAPSGPPSEAVRLFFDRTQARDPRVRPTPETNALAAQICTACDGVPMAIELAAACTGSMTLAEIARRLEDTLGLLMFGARAAPARQHSLRASIDWSHRLLPTKEQLLLRRLSVFEAEFTLADAEWVCAFDGIQAIEIGYLLDRLVAQSLAHAAMEGSTTRFSMWRPLRQYGFEQLVQAEELEYVRTRLAEWSGGSYAPGATSAADPRKIGRPLPARGKSSCRRADALSERERCVVELIAGGRSNREIADALVITKKTAEAHVSHILTKLSLCSRVQIATWSLQQGVVDTDMADTRTR
jgi:non-specific serine/threonine protein kinase